MDTSTAPRTVQQLQADLDRARTREAERLRQEARENLAAHQRQQERAAEAARVERLRLRSLAPIADIINEVERTNHAELYVDGEGRVCSKVPIDSDSRWLVIKRRDDIVAFLAQRAANWIIA